MARKGSELTIEATATDVAEQPKAIVRRKKGEIQTQQPTGNAIALAVEELEIAFADDDLRLALIQALVKHKQIILEQASQEEKIAEAVETARLEAIEQGRNKGIQQARSTAATKKREQKIIVQRDFVNNELPKILDAVDGMMSFEKIKETANSFASRVGVKLEWEEYEDGTYEYKPIF